MPTCSSCGESAPFHELSNFSVPSTEKCKRLCFKCVQKEWTQSVADHIERDFAVLHVKRALGLDETDLKSLDDVEREIEQLKSNNRELVSSTLRLKHDLEFQLNAAQQQLERVKAQRDAMRGPEMPGAWVCDKCGFTLQKNVLHTLDGSISANVADHCEGCPNDGSVMRPLTWREVNEDLFKRATSLLAENTQMREALEQCLELLQHRKQLTLPSFTATQLTEEKIQAALCSPADHSPDVQKPLFTVEITRAEFLQLPITTRGRILEKNADRLIALTPPESGEVRKCLVCAKDKVWGVFDSETGASVCKDCRDAAMNATEAMVPVEKVRPLVAALDGAEVLIRSYAQRLYADNSADLLCNQDNWCQLKDAQKHAKELGL